MATIEAGRRVLTLINIFTCEPPKQRELVALLVEATEKTMKHMPGFISANIHRSLDGKRVVNYAQWRDQESFDAMRKDPRAIPHMQAAGELATFEPILCEVSESVDG